MIFVEDLKNLIVNLIIIYKNGEYEKVYKKLVWTIEKNKEKIGTMLNNNKKLKLNIIQTICLYYMIGMCDKDQYNKITNCWYVLYNRYIYIISSENNKSEYKKTYYDKIEII